MPIVKDEAITVLSDQGFATEHKWRAICPHSGVEVVFFTYAVASWYLEGLNNLVEGYQKIWGMEYPAACQRLRDALPLAREG